MSRINSVMGRSVLRSLHGINRSMTGAFTFCAIVPPWHVNLLGKTYSQLVIFPGLNSVHQTRMDMTETLDT